MSNIYNLSGGVVSDLHARAEDRLLYVRYDTDANIVNYFGYEFT